MKTYLLTYGTLAMAIISETIATSYLKQSQQFTQWLPSVICIFGYALAFYLLSFTLRTMSVGIAYAIWSAAGIVLISIIGILFFKQHLDTAAYIGLALIIAGVIVINVFSNSVIHVD